MISVTTRDNLLKNVYGPAVKNQVNDEVSPFFQAVDKTTKYTQAGGKKFVIAPKIGVNGGVGFIADRGAAPSSGEQMVRNFETTAKSLVGRIEVDDKEMEQSMTSQQAFMNVMDLEMNSLVNTLKIIQNIALFTGEDGKLATISAVSSTTLTISEGIRFLVEGMQVDIYGGSTKRNTAPVKILAVNNAGSTKTIVIDAAVTGVAANDVIYIQGSKGNSITGLGEIFNTSGTSLYGVTRSGNPWLNPYDKDYVTAGYDSMGRAINEMDLFLANQKGSAVDMFMAGGDAYANYVDYLETTSRNVNTTLLKGGYTAIMYGDRPIINDRFAEEGTLFAVNTKVFHEAQVADLKFLDGYAGGKGVFVRSEDYLKWIATAVKYYNLLTEQPSAIGRVTNFGKVTEADTPSS